MQRLLARSKLGGEVRACRKQAGLRAFVPACPRALVPALVLGDTSGVDDDLAEQFRRTGLTHLTAVSGANLTLLLVFLRVVAVRIGVRGRWLTGVLLAGVAAFVAVCLGEPSVVRAAAMGVVGMAALGRGSRPGRGVRYLATAVLGVVLVDPWLSRSVGFWLSALAAIGTCWAMPRTMKAMLVFFMSSLIASTSAALSILART